MPVKPKAKQKPAIPIPGTLAASLANFKHLPDEAGVPVQVASAVLSRSIASIWRDLYEGRLDSFNIGRSRRITVASLRAACAGRSN